MRRVEVLPLSPLHSAWVIPSSIDLVYLPDATGAVDWMVRDFNTGLRLGGGTTAAIALSYAQCAQHTLTDGGKFGLTLTDKGRLSSHACDVGDLPVACSAPVTVAVRQ